MCKTHRSQSKSSDSKLSVTLPTEKRKTGNDFSVERFGNQSSQPCDAFCAYSTMYFHRSKMSEYLCHQYLANEILEELDGNKGMASPLASEQTDLLEDEGSSAYSIWLKKNKCSDDEEEDELEVLPDEDSVQSDKEDLFYQGNDNDYEMGEVTGFVIPAPHSPVEEQYHPIFVTTYSKKKPKPKEKEYWPSPRGKGWIGEDIFDIGLSALAFLAFGAFITNLIITCLLGTQNSTVAIQMNTTMNTATATATGTATGKDAFGGRYLNSDPITDVNQLANLVLLTLDKLEDQPADNKESRCLHYTLCNNNRVNKVMQPSHRFWLPLWSFALSWLSGRLKNDRLENLRASVLGLGGAHCSQLYPNCE